jgi:hypothetical protein
MIKKLPTLKNFPLVACTGHSLGGTIAKMLAPVTGVSTYTFNSPGVLQILRENSPSPQELKPESSPKKLRPGQEVLTFIANGDVVGNFRWEDDFGKKEEHIFLPILGSERIPYTRVTQYLTVDGIEYLKNTMMKYHGIVDMFSYLKTAEEARKHRSRGVIYVFSDK